MKSFIWIAVLVGFSSNLFAREPFASDCPTNDDLDHGIVFSVPARVGTLHRRYRRLDGAMIGVSYINGIFANGVSISLSGLFTSKHWRGDTIVQIEEPQSDLATLLEFKPGTQHYVETLRFNPTRPSRKWRDTVTYHVTEIEDFKVGRCIYKAVEIEVKGKTVNSDGEVHDEDEKFIIIPELLLRVSGPYMRYGDVSMVRKRNIWDSRIWPFVSNAPDVLND